jgi:hypothetical protein
MADAGITRIDISVQIACARILTAKDGSKFRVDQADLTFVPDGDRWAVTSALLSGPDVEPDGALSMARRNGLRLTPPDSSGTIPERINAVLGACMPGGEGRISTDSEYASPKAASETNAQADEPEPETPHGCDWACTNPACDDDTPHAHPGDCPRCGEPLALIGADGYEVTS